MDRRSLLYVFKLAYYSLCSQRIYPITIISTFSVKLTSVLKIRGSACVFVPARLSAISLRITAGLCFSTANSVFQRDYAKIITRFDKNEKHYKTSLDHVRYTNIQVSFHVLQVINVTITGSSDNIKPILEFLPNALHHVVLIATVIRSFMSSIFAGGDGT